MKQLALIILAGLVVAGCSTTQKPSTFPGQPRLSLVGEGLEVERSPLPVAFREEEKPTVNSLWTKSNRGLFHDRRARDVGDIVTVSININDKAQFDNTSGRSRQGGVTGSLAAKLGFGGFGAEEQEGDIGGNLDLTGSTNSKGQGSIDRSEQLRLSIAAVVTEVLPDGNLLITGTQEVRVNHEVRVLNIAGIIRPLDISADNHISYEKIAEARISYGGRGKLSAVQ